MWLKRHQGFRHAILPRACDRTCSQSFGWAFHPIFVTHHITLYSTQIHTYIHLVYKSYNNRLFWNGISNTYAHTYIHTYIVQEDIPVEDIQYNAYSNLRVDEDEVLGKKQSENVIFISFKHRYSRIARFEYLVQCLERKKKTKAEDENDFLSVIVIVVLVVVLVAVVVGVVVVVVV